MRYLKIVVPVLLVATGIGVWAIFFRGDGKPGQEKITICQYGQVFIYMPLYVAQEKGFFADEGIDVRLINGGGDDKTFATVASGEAQFGVADPTFPAIARERGQPGVVLASVVNGATFWGVTKKELKPITSAAQLKDLRIATYTAPSTNYTLMAKTLKDNEDRVGKAQIVQGAFGTLLAMLDADKADIAMELEPTVSLAVKNGAKVVYSYPEMYGPFLLTGLYTTEEYRDKHPEICQKVVRALERAMRYCHDNPEGTIEVARKAFPEVDPEVAANAVKRLLKDNTIPKHVSIDDKAWENAVQVRLQVGDLKSAKSAEKTIDNTFAAKATQASEKKDTK
jgi:NitT/TauT family transport system substrate-binding protein